MDKHVIQKTTRDGKFRVTVDFEEYAENPLGLCDFLLHVNDWDRNYSLRGRKCNEHESARQLLEYLLRNYGDYDKIIERLVNNGKPESHNEYDTALIYNRIDRQWNLKYWTLANHEGYWSTLCDYDCKKEDLDLYDILYEATDECISDLAWNCMTDKVKIAGYSFGYYDGVGFHDNFSSESAGIAYFIKDECVGDGKWFTEEQWDSQTCIQLAKQEIEEIEAWSGGRVYCFTVEKSSQYRIHKACLSEQKPMECYTITEWDEIDSCCGFYGSPNYAFEYALENNDLKKDDFDD